MLYVQIRRKLDHLQTCEKYVHYTHTHMSIYVFGVLQLVLPRCMSIVAIFFVYVIQKHAE